MAIKTPAPASSGSFDDYVRSLSAEVHAAAKIRWEDPVAFLWRARRVGEALLHALRVRHVPGSGHEPSASIDSLLKHEQLRAKLGRENLIDLQGLQNLGNTGSHIQGEAINYEHTAGVAAAHLANVVTWFFRAQHPRGAVSGDLTRALELMRDQARWQSSPDNLAHRTEERIAKLTTELQRAGDAVRRRDDRGLEGSPPRRHSPARAALAALSIALPALGIGIALGRGCGGDRPPSRIEPAPPFAMDSPLVGVPDAGSVCDGSATSTADAAPAPRDAGLPMCPSDAVEVLPTRLELLPPPRRSPPWRARDPNLRAVRVTGRVCIDRRASTVAQLLAWRPTVSEVFNGCVGSPRPDAAPMPCLTHEEADAWCRSRGGRLPSLMEWEALARQAAATRITVIEGFQWTADPFPPGVFNLVPSNVRGAFVTRGALLRGANASPAHPHYSWNQHRATDRVHSHFVRCAFDLVDRRD